MNRPRHQWHCKKVLQITPVLIEVHCLNLVKHTSYKDKAVNCLNKLLEVKRYIYLLNVYQILYSEVFRTPEIVYWTFIFTIH